MSEESDSTSQKEDARHLYGHCLCGNVRLTVTPSGKSVSACHCTMCRRWAGGPFIAIDGGSGVMIEGEENVGVFDSSQWAERGFCKTCGSNLFYRIKESGQHFVAAGLFDDLGDMNFDLQVFIDEKPDYYSFANKTKTLTAAEVFAQFAPPN